MKINTKKVLVKFDGSPIQDVVNDKTTDAIVRDALVNSLMAPNEKDSGAKKLEKYDLAMRIYKQDEVDLTAEEAATIKECVGKLFAPIIVGQIFKLLDGNE